MRKLLVLLATALALVVMPAAAQAASPGNDDFANATIIDPSLPSYSDTVDITDATTEPSEPSPCYFTQKSVWYSITLSTSQMVRVDSEGSVMQSADPILNVYQAVGPGLGGLGLVGCAASFGSVTFQAQAGATYYLQAGNISGGFGTVHLSVDKVPPPANDNWSSATPIGTLPFSGVVDVSAATLEPGEPSPSCGSVGGSAWYAFTPSASGSVSATASASFASIVAAYTGPSFGALSSIDCRAWGAPLTFHVAAGTTYYLQVGAALGYQPGPMQVQLDVAPSPVPGFGFNPFDPSAFDTIQFYDQSYDAGQLGISSESWDFGDGATATGCCPTHRYGADGDYRVKLDVATPDGRTASTTQVVHVKTHDVAIAKISVPQSASSGQTRTITVGLSDNRYPETVQMELFKSVPGGFERVGTLTQSVPVRGGSRTTDFKFSYTFTSNDADLGKVSFQAVATIVSARDALPADNTATALPTKVGK